MDEPTNMLDMQAVIWLENHLQGWPSTLLVVSHDWSFLDHVSTDILPLHEKKIHGFLGNYTQYYEAARDFNGKVKRSIKMLANLPVLES